MPYKFTVTTAGKIFRLDETSGKVWVEKGFKWKLIKEKSEK